MPNRRNATTAPQSRVFSAPSLLALVVVCLFLVAAAPADDPVKTSPVVVVKPVARPQAPAPAAQDLATLDAAREANRIARDGLAAQIEANHSQATLGGLSLVLSLTTGLAAIAAAVFAWGAWRANKRSADVAERLLTGYERPFLLVEVVHSTVKIEGRSVSFGTTQYRFRNLGRVPALITRRDFVLGVGAEMPEPLDPQKEIGKAVAHGVAVPAGGETAVIDVGSAEPLLSAFRQFRHGYTRKAIGPPSVYFHGFVEYRDLAGREWITGFCFEHSGDEGGFQPSSLVVRGGPDPYNYDRLLG
jgi:hypothetical protein